MANRQARFMTGLFVIGGVMIGVAAVVWLGASQYFEKGTRYVTYFDESVQGLQVDSRVKYRGVDVGSVQRIGVAPDQRVVEVVIKIDLEADIERSAVSQLKSAGITGIVFVELDRRQEDTPIFLPPAGMKTVYPIIASKPSQAKQMFSSVDRIMERIAEVDLKGVVDQLKQTSRVMETFLTGGEVKHIMKNLNSSTAELDRSLVKVDRILAGGKLEGIIEEMERGIVEARQGIGETRQVIGEATQGIGEIRQGIAETRQLVVAITAEMEKLKAAETAAKAKSLIEGLDRRSRAMAADLNTTTEEVRQAAQSLRMLIERLRENPSDLLFSRPVRDDWDNGGR
jgi:phospholipid/cholesterol/gamma-HCH transport system substrate-binding protein